MSSHGYLAPLMLRYATCLNCQKRKTKICLKCQFCYVCHPLSEERESKPHKSYFAIGNLFDIESAA